MGDDSKIVISGNFQRLSALLKGLGSKKDVQKAVARSIRRTLPSVQKRAFQEIRSRKILQLKQSEVKQRARAYVQGSGSTPVANQYGKIWITPKQESLGRFYARRVAAGRSEPLGGGRGFRVRLYGVKLNEYGAPYLKSPERTFLVDRKGGKIVFTRVAGAKRLPLEKQRGPGMAELLQKTGIVSTLAEVARVRYAAEFEQNLHFYAERALARALSKR
jgi:hypothetical protein